MNNYAVVVDGIVVNVAVWDGVSAWNPDGDIILVGDGQTAGPGWAYANGQFSAPPEEEPVE